MLKIKWLLILAVALVPAASYASTEPQLLQRSEDGRKGIISDPLSFDLDDKTNAHFTTRDEVSTPDPNDNITPHYTGTFNRYSNGRNLDLSMEMIDPKRHPKPKKPMGNDIGVARVPDSAREYNPGRKGPGISSRPDHLEATVSIGIMMGGMNSTQTEEAAIVSREMHDIMDSIPKVSDLHIANFELPIDPEEEAINMRITEVARQLAENATRKEYKEGKLKFVIPLPTSEESLNTKNLMKVPSQKVSSALKPNEKFLEARKEGEFLSPIAADGKSHQNPAKSTSEKTGKSFVPSNALPLVSHLPQEAAEMQLIGEVPQVAHFLFREGFPPMTLAPELAGPLLGGPLLKDEGEEGRIGRAHGRSIYFRVSQRNVQTPPTNFQDYNAQPNDVAVKAPTTSEHRDIPYMRKWTDKLSSKTEGSKAAPL